MVLAEAPEGAPRRVGLATVTMTSLSSVVRTRGPGQTGHGRLDSLPRLGNVVPNADDGLVSVLVLETEHAHAGGAAVEEPSGLRR